MSIVVTPIIGGTAGTPATVSGATSSTIYEFDVPAGTDISTVVLQVAATAADGGPGTLVVDSASVQEIYIQ
jgi:hypothetical protein